MANDLITIDELGSLSTIPADVLATVPSDTLQTDIHSGSSEAYSYLAGRYTLPLVSWGFDLKQQVANIVAYRVMCRLGYQIQGSDVIFREAYMDATHWLRDVSRNVISPDIVDTAPAQATGPMVSSQCNRGY